MSLFVLDTDTLTLIRQDHPLVLSRVAARTPTELAITVLTVEEQLSGWYTLLRQAKDPRRLVLAYEKLGDTVPFLASWRILPLTDAAMTRYQTLKGLKLPIGTMDLRIAAVVLENNAPLPFRSRERLIKFPILLPHRHRFPLP